MADLPIHTTLRLGSFVAPFTGKMEFTLSVDAPDNTSSLVRDFFYVLSSVLPARSFEPIVYIERVEFQENQTGVEEVDAT